MNFRQTVRLAVRLGFQPRVAVLLLMLQLAAVLLESFGLTILLPVFEFVRAGGNVAQLTAGSKVWIYIVDAYQAAGVPLTLLTLLCTSFAAIMLRQITVYVRLMVTAWAQNDLLVRIRNQFFAKYLAADSAYHDANPAGIIINDLTTELQRAIAAMFSLITMAGFVIMGVVYVSILVALSPGMTAGAFAAIMAAVIVLRRLLRKTTELGIVVTDANQQVSAFLLDRLRLVRLIRLSGTEAAEYSQLDTLGRLQARTVVAISDMLARVEVVMEPVVVAMGFLLLYVGVATLGLELEMIGLFLVIVIRMLPVMKEALRTRQSILSASGALEMLRSRLEDMEASAGVETGTRQLDDLGEGIRFEAVIFRYPNAQLDALRGVSLLIPAGKMTALVGPSGSGKSTLIDMLPRLRRPQSGQVSIGGIPLESYDLTRLRGAIAYVPQTPQIFNVTAAEHIRYGRADATMDEIRDVCRIVAADEFIERLPNGYDTLLGSDGLSLSGGQRQRIDLARALIKRAKILILDEPTASLDAESEQKFQQTLLRLRQNGKMTIIVIAHRFSTIAMADQIVVLRDGQVAETGRHDSLLAKPGWYAGAFGKQQLTPDSIVL